MSAEFKVRKRDLIHEISDTGEPAQIIDLNVAPYPLNIDFQDDLVTTSYVDLIHMLDANQDSEDLPQIALEALANMPQKNKQESFRKIRGWAGNLGTLDARQQSWVLLLHRIAGSWGQGEEIAGTKIIEDSWEKLEAAIQTRSLPEYFKHRMSILEEVVEEAGIKDKCWEKGFKYQGDLFEAYHYLVLELSKKVFEEAKKRNPNYLDTSEYLYLNFCLAAAVFTGVFPKDLRQVKIAHSLMFDSVDIGKGAKKIERLRSEYGGRAYEHMIFSDLAINWDPNHLWDFKTGSELKTIVSGLNASGRWLNIGAGIGIGVEESVLKAGVESVVHIEQRPHFKEIYVASGGHPDNYVCKPFQECIQNGLSHQRFDGFFLINLDNEQLLIDTVSYARNGNLAPGGVIIAKLDSEFVDAALFLGFRPMEDEYYYIWHAETEAGEVIDLNRTALIVPTPEDSLILQ